MKISRFSDERIAFTLLQAKTLTPVATVVRKMGVAEQMSYRRKKKYGGLGATEVRKMRPVEEDNR